VPPQNLARTPEPKLLDSFDAVAALLMVAYQAQQRGDLDEQSRLVSRIFRDLSGEDRKAVLRQLTEFWLRGLAEELPPADLARAQELCQQGIAASASDRLIDAGRCFAEARMAAGVTRRVHPALDMLALGAMHAGKLAVEDVKREAVIKDLIGRASPMLVTASQRDEGIGLLRQALAIMPDPPLAERDRVRAERIRTMIEAHTGVQRGAPGSDFVLPPPGGLSADAWNQLGEKLTGSDARHALICFERAIAADPTVAAYWLNKATALMASDAPLSSVAEAFEKAARRSPEDIRAWVGLASALQQSGRYRPAIEAWDAALRLAPSASVAMAHRAFCVRAASLFREGAGWDARSWLAKGMELLESHDWALADTCFDRTLEREPRHVAALCGKAVNLYSWASDTRAASGAAAGLRYSQAAACLREVLEIEPDHAAARDLLSRCEAALAQQR
jgi:tetratricopeptide (TPR) repeat protein